MCRYIGLFTLHTDLDNNTPYYGFLYLYRQYDEEFEVDEVVHLSIALPFSTPPLLRLPHNLILIYLIRAERRCGL